MFQYPDRDAIAHQIRPAFEELMADEGVPEEDWEFYWTGFLDDHIAFIPYDTQD